MFCIRSSPLHLLSFYKGFQSRSHTYSLKSQCSSSSWAPLDLGSENPILSGSKDKPLSNLQLSTTLRNTMDKLRWSKLPLSYPVRSWSQGWVQLDQMKLVSMACCQWRHGCVFVHLLPINLEQQVLGCQNSSHHKRSAKYFNSVDRTLIPQIWSENRPKSNQIAWSATGYKWSRKVVIFGKVKE